MSAWEQWGTKRSSSSSVLNGAQDTIQNLLRASPISSTTSSEGSNPIHSLKKIWGTSDDNVDALESGETHDEEDDTESSTFPLWRKKKVPQSTLLPSMSW